MGSEGNELKQEIIDLHAHILPGVDDGSEDMADTREMLELAAESGVSTIVCTPHVNIPGQYENYWGPEMAGRMAALFRYIEKEQLGVRVLPGMEIFTTGDIAEKIRTGKVIPLNFTKYYLLEFGFRLDPAWMTERLAEVAELGVIPVIAHPERYACVQDDPDVVRDWLDLGCQLQINKASMFGKFGRGAWQAAGVLLSSELVTYVASDAHSSYQRTTWLRDAYEFLASEFSERTARLLLIEHQQELLASGQVPLMGMMHSDSNEK